MPGFTLKVVGVAEDAAELVDHFAAFVREHDHHGIQSASVASPQFTGDPRDLPALDADPNAPVDPVPAVAELSTSPGTSNAVAEPDAAAPATDDDVSRETGIARDDLPAASDHDPGPVPDGA